MNKDLSLKSILLILIPFSILLYGYIWANDKETDTPLPGLLKLTPWNTASLTMNNGRIFEFSPEGALLRTLNTEDLGINRITGDIQFLNKNEIIIYGGGKESSLSENMESFARLTPNKEFSLSEGLWRCNFQLRHCEAFTHELPKIKGVFHMAYDFEREHLYITDTRAHMLYRLNSQGEILSQSSPEELKFPNRIFIKNDRLWLVDTNHKQIKSFRLGEHSLDKHYFAFDIDQESDCYQTKSNPVDVFLPNPKCWPGSVAMVGNQLWVPVMENGMEKAIIHRYELTGKRIDTLNLNNATLHMNLAQENDPTAMAVFDRYVVILDFNNLMLMRFDRHSKTVTELKIDTLETVLQGSREHKAYYTTIANSFMALFGVLLIIGFSVALKDHFKSDRMPKVDKPHLDESPKEQFSLPKPDSNPFWFTPSKLGKYLIWVFYGSSFFLVLSLIALFGILDIKDVDILSVFVFVFGCLSLLLPSMLIVRSNANKRLGISGRLLLISDGSGHTAMCPLHEAKTVGNRGILVEDTLFVFGNQQNLLINKEEFEHFLQPRLKWMVKMSEIEYMKYRWKSRHKESLILGASLIPAIILALYLSVST